MEVLLIAVMAIANVLCFMVGAKVGQQVSKGEEVKLPNANPVQAIREHREQEEAKKEQDRVEILWQNIERYDGTPYGQKDVPGR